MSEKEEETLDEQARDIIRLDKPINIKEFVENARVAVVEGYVNPLDVHIVFKRMQKVSEEFFKLNDVKECVTLAAEKGISDKVKSFERFGAKISVAATYTFYDFSECKHYGLDKAYEALDQLKEYIKVKEDELKQVLKESEAGYSKPGKIDFTKGVGSGKKGLEIGHVPNLTFEETDDIVNVNPPKKIQKRGVKVKL